MELLLLMQGSAPHFSYNYFIARIVIW